MFSDMLAMFDAYPISFYITVTLIGLTVGSFLNVVIFRFPKMLEKEWYLECREFLADEVKDIPAKKFPILSLSKPASTCPKCQHKIRFYENVPVISWLFLKGKCSQCKEKISIRYPLVEAVTAGVSLLVAMHFGVTWLTLAVLVLTWGLICLTMIDFDHMLLPDQITLPLLWLGLIVNLSGTIVPLEEAVIGAIAGYMSLYSVYWLFKLLTGKEGMGFGDFKLVAVFGAWMGWELLVMLILLSSALGAIVGIMLIVFQGREKTQAIPFGPYIAIAGWFCLLWGDPVWQWYLRGFN